MTLDEQIAFLQREAIEALSEAQDIELNNLCSPQLQDWAGRRREDAAVLLTIENTLRAIRDEAR